MQHGLISWTHNTWNPWVGCDKVAPECAKFYIGREIRKQADWQGDGSVNHDADGDPDAPAAWKVRCGQPAAGEVMGRPFCQRHLALRPAGNR